MCFVWISEQTAIISPYSINWMVFFNPDRVCLLRGTDRTQHKSNSAIVPSCLNAQFKHRNSLSDVGERKDVKLIFVTSFSQWKISRSDVSHSKRNSKLRRKVCCRWALCDATWPKNRSNRMQGSGFPTEIGTAWLRFCHECVRGRLLLKSPDILAIVKREKTNKMQQLDVYY